MTGGRTRAVTLLRPDGTTAGERTIAVEVPVSIEVDGLGYAVMMMTPVDLAAFATGFMLTERLADDAADVIDIDPFETADGWIVRITLADRCRGRIQDRVRHRTSDTSCGLCGIAGLEQLRRPAPVAPPPRTTTAALFTALANVRDHQPLNAATGATHAAVACDTEGRIVAAYEDVGRHNALDKLVGGLAGAAIEGFILVTSRISFEMVDKALIAGAPLLVGVSAPTTLAIEHAEAHGLTLIALARGDAMLVVNDPWNRFASGREEQRPRGSTG
ncbi:formate dehydrogenase accessory sulfurtransferase FdhD [Sphingomonas sp. CFBP 8760]|uniref:formate dehydrogenase accessory sulfurtransferase FdhD n=1 Tax=Sphingomonas sp. CFBP 8760 TaxID=2775282 RepID=UPI00177C549C|nr:formate dehydrogenase accessory sulfurtransferase FdhD [Sphingomonas sp. CFBP 8760]